MSQLSFFSAETDPPALADLSGLLAAQGQPVIAGGRARISIVVDRDWRATALAATVQQAGLGVEVTRTDEGRPLVRTAAVAELVPLAGSWTRGAVKAVPRGWIAGARGLRVWALAAGRADDAGRYLLGLDPHAPDTHLPLANALTRAGIAASFIGVRGGGPALRVSGRRRMIRLLENIGGPPPGAPAEECWPTP